MRVALVHILKGRLGGRVGGGRKRDSFDEGLRIYSLERLFNFYDSSLVVFKKK